MPLTTAQRKDSMPFGAQREVAIELQVDPAYVSKVMDDAVRPKTEASRKKLRRTQVAIARKLRLPVAEAFPQTNDEAPQDLAHAS